MGEKLRGFKFEVPPEKGSKLEQLSNWLLSYELSRGERKKKLPHVEYVPGIEIENVPETYFEVRHEIKDSPMLTQDNTAQLSASQELTPIARVLQTHPMLRNELKSPPVKMTVVKNITNVFQRQYGAAKAIRFGFVGGLLVVFCFGILLLIR
jgi:hypothetical protein